MTSLNASVGTTDIKQLLLKIEKLQTVNQHLKRQAEEAQTNLQTTLSAVSHELKNTLTLIIGNMQLMEQDHPEILSMHYWPAIRSDLSHMQAFLMDLSSFKALHDIKLNCRLCDFNAFLRDIFKSCYSWFDGTHKRLILSCPDKADVLYADTARLYQVFSNLIKNGLEALESEGTVSLRLRSATEEETKHIGAEAIAVEVKDTGKGLSPDQKDQIFKPFYTEKPEGTGLGLPIARNIVEAHKGILSVVSEPGRGSTFTVLIPKFPDF